MASLTFKNLQDKVLAWLDEADDSETVLENVKEALNAANAKRAGSNEWAFLLESATGTLTPGVREYLLATDINTVLSVYNSSARVRYRQVPYRHYVQGDTVADGFIYRRGVLTLLFDPTSADTIVYHYYRQPTEMAADGDVPDIPYPYSRVLIYDALLDLGLYSEDLSPEKLSLWKEKQQQLELDLLTAEMDGNSLGADPLVVRSMEEDDE